MRAHISLLALPALCAVLAPARARAWTETQVTSCTARVDVTTPNSARVELEVGVRVTAGWLSRFELLGLEDDLELAPQAGAELRAVDGQTYAPVVSQPLPSAVVLDFGARRAAPGRGDYVLHVRYSTHRLLVAHSAQTADGRGARVNYRLPRWPRRLGNVSVRVLAPVGSRPFTTNGDEVGVGVRPGVPEAVEFVFRRVELPRTQSFIVELEVPRPPGPSVAAAPPLTVPETSARPNLRALALGLVLAVAWFAKRRWSRATARARALQAVPWLKLPKCALLRAVGPTLCGAAVPLFEAWPLPAAIGGMLGLALSVDLGFEPRRDTADLEPVARVARATRHAALLDVTTLPGCTVAVASYAVLVWQQASAPAAVSCAAWLAAPMFFTGTRATQLRAVRAHALRRVATAKAVATQPAFLRSSSTTPSSSLSSRVMTSGCGSKSTSAACSSS